MKTLDAGQKRSFWNWKTVIITLTVFVSLICLGMIALTIGTTEDPAPPEPNDGVGVPVSEWYFFLQLSAGWVSRAAYCAVTPGAFPLTLNCDQLSPPHFSLLTFVTPTGELPALTGQPLVMVLRPTGLCGTPTQGAPSITRYSTLSWLAQVVGRGLQRQLSPRSEASDGLLTHRGKVHVAKESATPAAQASPGIVKDKQGVQCWSVGGRGESPDTFSTFTLWGVDMTPGVPINFTATEPLFLMEGERFCTVGEAVGGKYALVCDQPAVSSAARFNLIPAAYPFAGLSSLARQHECSITPLTSPPPHDIECSGSNRQRFDMGQEAGGGGAAGGGAEGGGAAGGGGASPHASRKLSVAHIEAHINSVVSTATTGASGTDKGIGEEPQASVVPATSLRWQPGAKKAANEGELITTMTLFRQLGKTPPDVLTNGESLAMLTYSPGVVGFPLQQCCPSQTPPYLIDCGVQEDPIPKHCFFTINKLDAQAGAPASGTDPLRHGDTVMLRSPSLGRYCSTSIDGSILCVSSGYSNATRMLFTLRLGQKAQT